MRKTKKLWMLAAILVIICGTSVFTSWYTRGLVRVSAKIHTFAFKSNN